MKIISFWAKSHRWWARFLIVLLYIPFNFAAINTGELLFAFNGPVPTVAGLACVMLLLTGIAGYKTADRTGRHARYNRRVICHISMLAATFGLLVFGASRMQPGVHAYTVSATASAAAISSTPPTKPAGVTKRIIKQKVTRFTFRQLRKLVRSNAGQPGRPLTEGEKILFVILSIVGGVVLTFLLAALSCSIACSGGEAIALILLIAGAAGIAIGLTALIRHITRSPTKSNFEPYAFKKKVFAAARRRSYQLLSVK
jgi:hypothetical protein